MGDMGLIFTFVLVRYLLGPPGLFKPITSISWTHTIASPNSPIGRHNPPPVAHRPHHPLSYTCNPRYAIVVKKLAVLVS